MKLQKLGGWAAIVLACISVLTVGIGNIILQGFTGSDTIDAVKMMAA
jgi:hypothetical protein